ncbi:YciC family protein [Phenylobacterium sp.]|jgi:hypothetical protein|uniref:YciC family protein n=1 Tax=Phenylobacterium sp. TaxID=1871053 RepID=UPI002E2F9B4F|nr:YciC family protein [Phenylobacterium sp.]HEX2559919.1 YciC family protein [Phenylobacterium sp.]
MVTLTGEAKRLTLDGVVRRALQAANDPVRLSICCGFGIVAGVLGGMGEIYAVREEFGAFGLYLAVASLVGLVLTGFIATNMVAIEEGRPGTPLDNLSLALSRIPALFGFSILTGLAIMVGLILLIVPGVMMSVAWAAGGAALVAERLSPTEAIRRSADLTRGSRWAIFGIYVIGVIVLMIALVALDFLGVAVWGETPTAAQTVFLGAVSGLIFDMPYALGTAAIYLELRDGDPRAGHVAAVFS